MVANSPPLHPASCRAAIAAVTSSDAFASAMSGSYSAVRATTAIAPTRPSREELANQRERATLLARDARCARGEKPA
jgi:hypothetical protein